MATSHDDRETAPVPHLKATVAPTEAFESEIGSDTTRVQLVLPAERVRMLDQLAAEAGVTTRKDLFNNALALLNWAVREVRRGRVIASVDERAQRFTELQMPMLDAVAANATAKSSAR
jgi:ferric iron reductase protein FhuF